MLSLTARRLARAVQEELHEPAQGAGHIVEIN